MSGVHWSGKGREGETCWAKGRGEKVSWVELSYVEKRQAEGKREGRVRWAGKWVAGQAGGLGWFYVSKKEKNKQAAYGSLLGQEKEGVGPLGSKPSRGGELAFGPKVDEGEIFPFSFFCFLFVSFYFKVFSKQFQINLKTILKLV